MSKPNFKDKLVVAIASSALFDLTEGDRVFRDGGCEPYRAYQRAHEGDVLKEGCAFSFIRRLLGLNEIAPKLHPVEVILLSRNDPDTGLRVFNSIEAYGLSITRAVFTAGKSPFSYMRQFGARLFLSANEDDVCEAIRLGHAAGQVLGSAAEDDPDDPELRIAFDFDGVLADDASERIYREKGLDEFRLSEAAHANEALNPGPLKPLLEGIAHIQELERQRQEQDRAYQPRLRIAIATAREAPAHKRVVTTLREWGMVVDDAFFLGGIDKGTVIAEYRPHIFFDDQASNLLSTVGFAPSVHVPFGVANSARCSCETEKASDEDVYHSDA